MRIPASMMVLLALAAVANNALPQTEISSPRHSYLRGEVAEITVSGEGSDKRVNILQLVGQNVPGRWKIEVPEDGHLSLDTAPYRVGDYRLVAPGEETGTMPLYIRRAGRPRFWFGNFIGRHPGHGPGSYEQLRSLGMNAAYNYGMSPDDALRHGVYLVHHGNALRGSLAGLPDEEKKQMGQVFSNCRGTTKPGGMPCMRNPAVIERAGDRAAAGIRNLVSHPGLLGIGLDDEVSMFGYDWNDTGGVTGYCEACRRQWKEKTGHGPPAPPCLDPGAIIPEDDPYHRYMIEWTGWGDYYGPAEADYNRTLARRIHALRDDLIVFQTPGAAFGELDVVHWEIYDYWLSSPATGALSSMSLVRALQREEYGAPKSIWPLIGWFQRIPAPEWTGDYINAQVGMCLAEGAESIWLTLMYWYDSRGRHKLDMLHGAEHIRPEMCALGEMLGKHGPALKRVRPVRYPVAVLRSRTTEGYQRIIDPARIEEAKERGSWLEQPWEHGQATGMGFAALLRAGVPAEFITERDVLQGQLENYGALVLLNHEYSPRNVVDRINGYAQEEGLVLADGSSVIRPDEAVELPFDASQFTRMINLGLRAARKQGERLDIVHRRTTGLEREWALLSRPLLDDKLPDSLRPLRSSSLDVIPRMGRSGTTDYLYVLNAEVEEQRSAEIEARTDGRFAYEVLAGDTSPRTVVDGKLRLRVDLAPGEWKVYAITRRPMSGLHLEVKKDDGTVRAEVAVTGPDGSPIEGAFPIRLTVRGPKGRRLPYGGSFGTDAGRLAHEFRPAVNDPAGEWTVRAVNLITGHTAEASFQR